MKTNKLILLGLICLTVAMPTTAQNRNEKKARTERAVKEAIAAKYTTRALKKGKIQIDFKTRSDEDNYEYRLTIFPDGSTSIHVQPMNKQSISFTGEMDTEK